MDEGLFAKHLRSIKARVDRKKEIIDLVSECAGITLKEEEIILAGKKCSLHTSSVKHALLLRKGVKEMLIKRGYIVEI